MVINLFGQILTDHVSEHEIFLSLSKGLDKYSERKLIRQCSVSILILFLPIKLHTEQPV